MTAFEETDAFLERVASGTGSKRDVNRVRFSNSGLRTSRTQGLSKQEYRDAGKNTWERGRENGRVITQRSAGVRAANMRARDARVSQGRATVIDLLAVHGGDRLIDLGGTDKEAIIK
jgi:hypothetical protein